MNKLVTVMCTVKNGEDTIIQTVDSVLNQTYKNIELIIIDDGSTDNTLKILNKINQKDKRVKICKTGGIGRVRSLNQAIELSKGVYIANIDADDLMHPRKIELQVNFFDIYPNYFLIGTNSLIIFENEKPNWKIVDKNIELENVDGKIFIQNPIIHPSVMMNKDKLIKLGNYNTKQKTQIDYELWLRAFSKNEKMGNINQKLVAKRIHRQQSYENKKRIRYTFNSMKLKMNYILKDKKKLYMFPIPIILFILAQLPFSIRNSISNFLK